jgi:hypothetical protein
MTQTTDHDPRELRAIAKRVADGYAATTCCTELGDYVLATVREDDGEEQPDTTIPVCNNTAIMSDIAGVFVRDRQGTYSMIRKGRPTRGQFRALCRGLGIVIE